MRKVWDAVSVERGGGSRKERGSRRSRVEVVGEVLAGLEYRSRGE